MLQSDEHTVLVLGAGASVAEAKGHRPSRPRAHPPLDADFFQKILRDHAEQEQFQRMVAHSDELGQPDLCSSVQPISLEQYLGRLYFEMSSGPSGVNVGAYYDLVRLYAAELLNTTNWMMGRKGSLSQVIRRHLEAGRRLSIITFNHDLLAENALDGLPQRMRHGFCLDHSYGFSPSGGRCAVDSDPQFSPSCHGDGDVAIFKLHGSVNWVYRTAAAIPPADVTRGRRSILLYTNKEIHPWSNTIVRRGRGRGRASWHLWPMIIPPVYEKHGLINGGLQRIWAGAANALRDATQVVFFGYSFPLADLHARYFFQGLAQENAYLRRPVLINPDPGAHSALWEVLRPEWVLHFHDVHNYLDG